MFKIKRILYNIYGMTLIELIAAITIMGLIMSPILYIYLDYQVQSKITSTTIQAQTDAGDIMKAVIEDLRKVGSSTAILSSSSVSCIDVVSDNLIIRYDDNNNNVTDQIVYGLVSGNLYKYKATTQDVTSISDSILQTGSKLNTYTVSKFTVTKTGDTVSLTIEITPPNIGSHVLNKISVSNNFIPRYSDIRDNQYIY